MFIKRTKGGSKGNPINYLQLVESYRDESSKPKHKVLCTLGREDELIDKNIIDDLIKKFANFSTKSIILDESNSSFNSSLIFGPILAFESIWKKLDFDNVLNSVKEKYKISFDFNNAVKLMLFNRLIDPKSKMSVMEWKDNVYSSDFEKLELQHLYRSLDILADNRNMLQKELYNKTISLFKPNIKLAFYDLTTIYFESQQQDVLKKYGYSKDNKTDCVQIVIGLIISEDNIPLGYEMFPGNTFEGKTVKTFIDKLKNDYEIEKIVFVADRGILSKQVLNDLETAGYEYIVAAKLPQLKKEYHSIILDKSSMKEISEGVLVSETIIDNRRLVYGFSQKRAGRDKYMREELLRKLNIKLSKDPKSIIAKPVYRKFLAIGDVKIQIDDQKIKQQEEWDGLFGYYTNNHEISSKKVVETYHLLWQIEESFRCMKSTLDLRPVYHWTEKRIEGHIMLCFLSFYFLRVLQKKLQDDSITISYEKILESLNKIQVIPVEHQKQTFFVRTQIADLNNKILRNLSIKIPPMILNQNVVE